MPATAVLDRRFSPEIKACMDQIPWWRSFGLWATILVGCVVALYLRFL